MLKPYERKTHVSREIQIEPHLLTCNIHRIIKDKVWNVMKTVCSGEYGFVLRLDSIDSIGKGTIDTDSGTVVYPVDFTITSFKPDINSIVIAKVTAVSKSGFFAQLGPLEIFVPHTHIPDSYTYKFGEDEKGQDENMFENELSKISKDAFVRIRICAIQKMDIEEIFESLSIQGRIDSNYIGGVLEAIGELIDE
jgi:DNA-directed RNA polymerase II subunit RPB7